MIFIRVGSILYQGEMDRYRHLYISVVLRGADNSEKPLIQLIINTLIFYTSCIGVITLYITLNDAYSESR
jgi:hypothetical protein